MHKKKDLIEHMEKTSQIILVDVSIFCPDDRTECCDCPFNFKIDKQSCISVDEELFNYLFENLKKNTKGTDFRSPRTALEMFKRFGKEYLKKKFILINNI